MDANLRIGIVGGSIGGLSAALWLRDAGFDVTVFERSPVPLQQRGAGIGFLKETSKFLEERAGVDLDEISVKTELVHFLHRDGSVKFEKRQPYRFTSWNTVYRESLKTFGSERYMLGKEMVDFSQTEDEVSVQFSDGTSISFDLVVMADGVHSQARHKLLPEVSVHYAGYVGWRGLTKASDISAATFDEVIDKLTYYTLANSHIIVYPIPGHDGSVKLNERLLNFVWYRNYLEGDDLDDVMTDVSGICRPVSIQPGQVRQVHIDELHASSKARLPALISEVVCAAEEPFLQALVDCEIPKMVFGRICLLGDSAWVARSHAAAGTAKAADESYFLAQALLEADSVPEALANWEPGRLKLGKELVDRNIRVGRRSQVDGNHSPFDPEVTFSLYPPKA